MLAPVGSRGQVHRPSPTPRRRAEVAVAEIRAAGGEAVSDGHSVAERDGARAIIGAPLDAWGRVDILINDAGIAPFARFDEISDRTSSAHMTAPMAASSYTTRSGRGCDAPHLLTK